MATKLKAVDLTREPADEPAQREDCRPVTLARTFPASLDALADRDVERVPLESRDFYDTAPGDPDKDW